VAGGVQRVERRHRKLRRAGEDDAQRAGQITGARE